MLHAVCGNIRNTGCLSGLCFSVSFDVGASDMVVKVMPLVTVMLNVVMVALGVVLSKQPENRDLVLKQS